MRANEFLKEYYDFNVLVDTFFENCSEFFSFNDNPISNTLWRGDYSKNLQIDNLMVNTRNVEQGREPVDTDKILHKLFNNVFTAKFNIPFRDGMMCSGSRTAASDYGHVYIIIPGNGYTLCYSQGVSDLYKEIPDSFFEKLEYVSFDVWDNTNEQKKAMRQIKKLAVDLIEKNNYKAGSQYTSKALMSGNEVMLYPTNYSSLSYYAFSEGFWLETMVPIVRKKLYES